MPLRVHRAKTIKGVGVAFIGRLFQQTSGFGIVLGDTEPISVKKPQLILGTSETLIGGGAIPLGGGCVALLNARSILVSKTKQELRLAETLDALATRRLEVIDRALDHAAQGRLSVCDGCGGRIPLTRLRALPGTTRCVRCARDEERGA